MISTNVRDYRDAMCQCRGDLAVTALRRLRAAVLAPVLLLAILLAGCAHQVQPGEDPHPSSWVGLADASGSALMLNSGNVPVGGTVTTLSASYSPCDQFGVNHTYAAINLTAAGATYLAPPVAGKIVHICGIYATLGGTAPTLELEAGTTTTNPCDTGTTALTGAMAPLAGTALYLHGMPKDLAVGASGAGVCALIGGTTPSLQGIVQYVQQ